MKGVEILFKRIMFTCVFAWDFLANDSWTEARPLWSYHHGKTIAHNSHYHKIDKYEVWVRTNLGLNKNIKLLFVSLNTKNRR